MTVRLRSASGREVFLGGATLTRSTENAMSLVQVSSHMTLLGELGREFHLSWKGKRVFTGVLETTSENPWTGYTYGLRSLVSALDKFDATGGEHFGRGSTVRSIAGALCGRAGVALGSIPHVRVNRFRIKRGDNYRQALQQLAETHQLVVTDDAHGRLVMFGLEPGARLRPRAIWAQGSAPTLDPVSPQLDISNLRAEYICRGQRVLAKGDLDAQNDEEIGETLSGAALPASRHVLPNKAATSRADALRLLDWTAKKRVGAALQVPLAVSEYPGDPGYAVRFLASLSLDSGDRLQISDTFVVSSVSADFVQQKFQVVLRLPEVYLRKRRLASARHLAARNWQKRPS